MIVFGGDEEVQDRAPGGSALGARASRPPIELSIDDC
jgi:hypothetical protein